MADATPAFLAEPASETAEFESVRDTPVAETPQAEPAPKPSAEAKPAPEIKPEAKPEVEVKKPGFVPHAALHEERLRRQALEKELADLRAGKATPEPEKAAPIDPETDPIGALKEIREFQQRQREEGERNIQLRAFDDRVRAHEADFATATPDYGDAITHLREARASQIRNAAAAMGQTIMDGQLGQMLMDEARTTSNQALQNGKNPGEVFYTLAKHFGYAGPKSTAEQIVPSKVEVASAEVIPALPTKEASEKIARLTKGQQAANKVGGGEPPAATEITLESLANLEGAAFDAAFNKFTSGQKRAERH